VGTAEATLNRGALRRKGRRKAAPKVSATQFRELLDGALAEVDADDRAGSLLRATGLRVRLRVQDLGIVVDVVPSEEGAHHLSWTFEESPRTKPKLELIMGSQAANAYLQGRESLAIAIARGRVRYKGETRCALRYLPAMRVVVDAYTRRVRRDHPDLVV
jgi:hypothetical protein